MFDLKLLYFCVIIHLSLIFAAIEAQKYEHINTYEISGQFWNGEATAEFTCAEKDNENDIFNDDPKYVGNYLKSRIGSIKFVKCRFSEIRRKYGLEFTNLHTLNVSNVQLEIMKMTTFKGCKKLLTLIASKNRLTEIPALVFADAKQLSSVDLSENSIRHINPLAFEGAANLKSLNLSNNQINQFDLQSISLTNLSVLDLSSNSLNSLNVVSLRNLPNLEHLRLRQAKITTIQVGSFSYQQKLISLDLSGNQLKELNFNILFPDLQNLRSLSLHQNQLTELHCVQKSELSEFVVLDLNNNQFNCSYLKRFIEFVNWQRIRVDSKSSDLQNGTVEGITCLSTNSNESSQEGHIFQIEFCPNNYKSDENETHYTLTCFLLIAAIATVMLICSSIVLITKRYRNKSTESYEITEGNLSSRPTLN